MYDVIVIGGGVTGCATLRELSKYDLKLALLEKEEDVCSGTSKANSAIVHAGFDAQNDTLKAKFNVRGNELIKGLSKTLNFPFINNGALVLCFDENDYPKLEELYNRGIKNGVKDLEIISGDKARSIEPNLTKDVVAALYAKTSGIVCPFDMNIAFGESAVLNGAEIIFNTKVEKIIKEEDYYLINDKYKTRCIVNAAGLYGDVIHNLVCEDKLKISPRKGDYCLFDEELGGLVKHTIFQLPNKNGKGVLVTPTVHGNLLIGPSASDILDKENTATDKEDLDYVMERAKMSVDGLAFNKIITSFSGLRARPEGDDFIIKESADYFFDAIGIESPGLSSAPAIGEYLSDLIVNKLNAKKKDNFIENRPPFVHLKKMNKEERALKIKENPLYGHIICRCNDVSEGEIIDALNRPIKVTSLDGIKRRTTAMMGRCQGGFCSPRIMEILSKHLGISEEEVCKNNNKSKMLMGNLYDEKI